MAEASISVDQDQFICPVCLDLLKDPVTIPCGHSFCKVCINDCWDQEDQKNVYSCPQCRDTFTPRPVLHRNNMLAEVVEKLKKSKLQAPSPDHCYTRPGDVECDFCIGRKNKAVKTCLVCVASYCEIHLKPHYVSPSFKKHTLTEVLVKLQEKICSEHGKLMEIYCRTDQTCICYLCMMDKHKGHDTITASGERSEKQSELKKQQMKSQQRIQEKQKKVQELKQAVNTIKVDGGHSTNVAFEHNNQELVESSNTSIQDGTEVSPSILKVDGGHSTNVAFEHNNQELVESSNTSIQDGTEVSPSILKLSAQTAVEDSEKIFTEMISFMEKKRSEMREMIRDQEKAELSRHERLLEQLEQEIVDLQRRVTELEQLSHTHDHIHFLQSFQSLCVSAGCRSPPGERTDFHTSSITVHHLHLSDGVKKYFSDLKKRLEEFCVEEFNKIPPQDQFFLSEPQSRDEFLKYFCYLTLDPNTAHRYLILSEKNRAVSYSVIEQQYSDHPERFDSCTQVLCKESVCGRCYWEVEWSGVGGVFISVSYKDISRKGRGNESRFGRNNQSWSLQCFSSSSLSFYHDNIETDLRVPSSSRIGVYVDHSAGTLSFYSVSDNMKLLHRVQTTFTQPLYAGFGLYFSSVKLCDPKKSV